MIFTQTALEYKESTGNIIIQHCNPLAKEDILLVSKEKGPKTMYICAN